MNTEEIFRYILSFLGGGLVLAILNWVKEARSVARQREIACLQNQLQLLYGPLHCLTAQTQEILKLHENLENSLNPINKPEPREEQIPPFSSSEAEQIIALMNAYTEEVKKNKVRIRQLLETNWSLIHAEDVAPFLAFLADTTRSQVEIDEKYAMGVAFRVKPHLGDIFIIRPEFVDQVTSRWNTLRKRLDTLLLSFWWPWLRRGRQAT
jgi:hypothetical protein